MKKLTVILNILFIFLIVGLAYSQIVTDYLITNDIGTYKKITKGGPSGNVLAGADHFGIDHRDQAYGIAYVNDETKMWIDVQVTKHAGSESDKWLLHEVERGFRRGDFEENMTSARFRNLDGNNIYYSGLGGGTYRWRSNLIIVNVEYTDLYKQKPEPLEVVKAYLVKFPSTIPAMTIDRTHNEQWIKDEMERRLWLCDKWSMQFQLGKVQQKEMLEELVRHMNVFLDYRQKYYGISAREDKRALENFRIQYNGTAIRNKFAEYKTWWETNKTKTINL